MHQKFESTSEMKETKFMHEGSQVEEATYISRITLYLLSRYLKMT